MTALHWILVAIGLAGQGFAAALAVRHYVHMLQLNSYKPRVQAQWIWQHATLWLWLCLPLGGLRFWPRHAKKPLQLTARAKRLLLCLALLCPLWWLATPLLPWVVLLANALNAPLEAAIRRKYTAEAKQMLASHPGLLVVGITGSFGKTSLKHHLHTLLRARYNVLMTPGGVNTPMGVVRCIREELTAAHQIFLCEMGAKQAGDIAELCALVQPTHGVLTALAPQHLESFGSMEAIVATKLELAQTLPPDGILFANADNPLLAQHCAGFAPLVLYGTEAETAGYRALAICANEHGSRFDLQLPDGQQHAFATALVGQHNVLNLAGALAVAHQLGVAVPLLQAQMRKIRPVEHRLQLRHAGDCLLLDDAYNSNPTGAKAALDTLAMLEGTKILVTPGMIELGAQQDDCNRTFGQQAAAVCDYVALVGAAQTRPIAEGLRQAGFCAQNLHVFATFAQAHAWFVGLQTPTRKVVLLENDLPDSYEAQ